MASGFARLGLDSLGAVWVKGLRAWGLLGALELRNSSRRLEGPLSSVAGAA